MTSLDCSAFGLLLLVLLPMQDQADLHAAGLHNVIKVTEKLLSGSSPEGDEGFASLQKLGVKTIISVDGAKPDLEKAKKYTLRYVHLPIGYDGVPIDQGMMIAKAVKELPGLIYLHCHHGKHRSPAAAAVVKLCLEPECKVEEVINLMKKAGTDPKYLGLYAAPKELKRPTTESLDQLKANFPEVAKTSGMMQSMVDIDNHWDNLKLIRTAQWQSPKSHPDLDPAHEALLLWEHYVELARLPETNKKPEKFHQLLNEATENAKELEKELRLGKERATLSKERTATAFQRSSQSCIQCHSLYRDVPQLK